MTFLPDTNACIVLLRQRHAKLTARWQAAKASEIMLCSVVVYELRHGAERSSDPAREHARLDGFLAPFVSLPFDDSCARRCASVRRELEGTAPQSARTICKSLPSLSSTVLSS